jgi:uncharacterized protein YhdP
MDDIATRVADAGVTRNDSGGHTGDGTILNVNLGYRPKRVELINVTDAIRFTKHDDMAAAATLQEVAAGTMTVQNVITINDRGFSMTAAANINAKVFTWHAM